MCPKHEGGLQAVGLYLVTLPRCHCTSGMSSKLKKNTSTYDNIYVKSLSKKQKQNIHLSHHGQVFLMAAPPSAFTGVVFQTHLGLLNGAVAALLFPVLDTYIMPGEVSKAVKVKTLVQIMV